MNVSQYSPNRKLERESIGSIDALPSVKEILRSSGAAAGGAAAGGGAGGAGDAAGGTAVGGAAGGAAGDAAAGGEGASGAAGGEAAEGTGALAAAAVVRSGTFEDDSAVYRYSIDERARCIIDRGEAKVARLSVPDAIGGCPVVVIGGHAFSTCYELERVELPSTVEEIREHAFMNTALELFEAPASLRRIGTKAFYRCERMREALLGAGLLFIGEGAFRESALVQLDIPQSVQFIGRDAFKGTALVFSGAGQTLRIPDENVRYGLQDGALYRLGDEGLELVQLLDEDAAVYEGVAGLVRIGSRAFAGNRRLRRAALPDGVREIGEAAFKGCTALAEVALPDSVTTIGRQAFRQTALVALRIPRDLRTVGAEAFYTGGSVARDFRQTIRSVEVAPGNERFYLEEETLCQRTPDGAIALLHFGTSPHVVVPRTVTAIGPYAFLNSRRATCVTMHDRIGSIDVGGLDFGRALSTVVYETSGANPDRYVIEYPPGDASSQMARITFGGERFDVVFAYAECDRAIMHASDLFTRARMMLNRLMNPIHLSPRAEALFRSRLKTAVPLICVEFGRNGYLEGVDHLLDLGFLDADNVQESIDAAIGADEVAVVSRLVEVKRTRFDLPLFDWDL